MLKDAPILILDEPTSSLDAISEAAVFDAFRRLRQGRTTLVIAHRLSTIRDADRILVLHEGRIAAQGTDMELLSSNQVYRRMCARLSIGKPLDDRDEADVLEPAIRSSGHMKILVAGIIARYPFGGVTWCSLMYLLGLRALGHEVLYIEDTGECIYDPEQNTRSRGSGLRDSLHQQCARALRAGRSLVLRQLQRRVSWRLPRGRPWLLRATPTCS